MRTFNRATLIGHVGNDVTLRRTQTGKPVVNLSLATAFFKKDGEETTTWHRVVLWDRLAELCERFVKKGQAVYVEGPLTTREYVDADGNKRHKTELVARELIFLGKGKGNSGYEDQMPDVVQRSGRKSPQGEELVEVRAEIPF
jgi:single-strand DNA-binding protein